MDFSQAEEKFRELQARIQRGEPLSEEQYQEELAKMMVQDDQGTFWSLEPGTGRWLFFNGTEWVPGNPPRPAAAPEVPAGVEAASAATLVPSGVEPESVPTYVRSGEAQADTGADRATAAGIPPRPVRGGTFLAGPHGQGAWLPFAIGAVVLMLCAAVLFFGVRGLSLAGGASTTPTPTEVVEVFPTAGPTDVPSTDTPAPTATAAATVTPSGVTVTTKDRVRVRSGPGTSFGILTTLDAGTTIPATGRTADSKWIQVQLPGKTDLGWASAEFLTINGDVNSLPVIQAASKPSATPKAGAKPKPTPTETPAG